MAKAFLSTHIERTKSSSRQEVFVSIIIIIIIGIYMQNLTAVHVINFNN